jgi:hypothetical protein
MKLIVSRACQTSLSVLINIQLIYVNQLFYYVKLSKSIGSGYNIFLFSLEINIAIGCQKATRC